MSNPEMHLLQMNIPHSIPQIQSQSSCEEEAAPLGVEGVVMTTQEWNKAPDCFVQSMTTQKLELETLRQ